MRIAVAQISLFVTVMVVAGCIGGFAPVGICATIWRYDCVESLIGPASDRSHPATWVFLALAVPSGLLAISGALSLYLALLHFFPWLIPETHPSSQRFEAWLIRWERRLVAAWGRNIRFRLQRLDEAKARRERKGPAIKPPADDLDFP